MLIGGLQGAPGGHKRDVIDATRELHGLRPKDATLLAARALAKAIGARSVHAVANRDHVLDRLSGASRHADYDAYWRERGATPGGPLGFVFPSLDEVAAESAGRGAFKAEIVAAMQRFVTAHLRLSASSSGARLREFTANRVDAKQERISESPLGLPEATSLPSANSGNSSRLAAPAGSA